MPVFLTRRREDAKENAGCCRGPVGKHEHEHEQEHEQEHEREDALYSCPFVVQITSLAKPLQGRSHTGKLELHLFVSIRVHSWFKRHHSRSALTADLRLVSPSYIYSWFIRVHSWFKKRLLAIIRENPCSSVAKKTPVAPHPRTPVRGSPDEHTPRVISTSRLRGFAASRESQRSQTTSTDSVTSVTSVVQKTFFAKSLQGRSRAGKPELRLFETGDRGH